MMSVKARVLLVVIFALPSLALAGGQPIDVAAIFQGTPGIEYFDDCIVISAVRGISFDTFEKRVDAINLSGNDSIDRLILEFDVEDLIPYYDGILKNEYMQDVVGRMYIIKINDPARLIEATLAFNDDPNLEFAEPFYINYINYVPNDPLISSGWYHLNRIEAYTAWDIIRGDTTSRPVIGIVDSGVYYDHPDLEPNMWINEAEDVDGDGRFTDADLDGIDDDGNGKTDDVVGYDIAENDNIPFEPIPWHGTHVAGCATMATDNAYGGAAVGWAARIMAIKCARDDNPNSIPYGYQGISYAVEMGCNIINCSWGRLGSPSQGEQNIINTAYDAGVIMIAAAGNDNSSARHYPASYNNVFSVASTGPNDIKSSFSNYGTTVDICAPGEGIQSTWDHGSFTALDGTSMASPIAAGAAALVLATNPDLTVDEVVGRLEVNADSIDHLNPNYAGMLGHGRVNIAAAVGRNIAPRLEITAVSQSLITDLDGDSLFNPGETASLVITLTNAWADAFDVVGTLISDGHFTFSDSVANFGYIPNEGGSGDNSADPFMLIANPDASIGDHFLTILITANGFYEINRVVTVNVTLEQKGFPIALGGQTESSPLIYDIDNDQIPEIITSANDGNYYVFENDGSAASGWPQNLGGETPGGPSIGNIDNAGDIEIVGTSRSGNIGAWTGAGTMLPGFPIVTGASIFAPAVLGDLDGNGDLEIVTTGFTSKKVFVYNHDGTSFGDWPYQGVGNFFGAPALADIDNDLLPEIIACDFDSSVHVWNADKTYVPGFPIKLLGQIWGTPCVVDIDGDDNLNIIVAAATGHLYVIDNDGSIMPGWPVRISLTNIRSAPSLADIDQDQQMEIMVGCYDQNLYVYNYDGTPQAGFPVNLGGLINGSPVVGMIDSDNQYDIILGSGDGRLYGYNYLGQPLRNFPIPTISGGPINGSAALADIDLDGDLEIIFGAKISGQNFEVIDYKDIVTNGSYPWPVYGNNIRRTSYYGPFETNGIGEETKPYNFMLSQNYPNPFNANTMIGFEVNEASEVHLTVYNLLGHRVKALISDLMPPGTYNISWDGRDARGNVVASGIYFYKFECGENSTTKRMLLMK